MKRTMTLKELMFVLPLLLLVCAFSLYPIITSGVYTLFDYQRNNQSLNKLFLSGSLNAGLFAEDLQYAEFYMRKDGESLGQAAQARLQPVLDDVRAMLSSFEGEKGVRSLSPGEAQSVEEFLDKLEADAGVFLSELSEKGEDVSLLRMAGLPQLLEEMRTCVIASNYVGLRGFGRLLSDQRFFNALSNTAVFTAVSVTLELVFGMMLALIMDKSLRGIGLVRTTALIPWAIPTAVSALMWTYLYDGTSGVVAMLFDRLGLIASPRMLLTTAGGTMASAILADVWKTTPYMALLLLAGLQVIDRGLYESSAIDGAGPGRTYFRITLPLLKPSILVALVFRTLDALRVYDLIQVLTKGTPETLSIYAYNVMVSQSNYGYGSVIVVGMFVFVALIAFVYVKVLGAELIAE